MARTAAKSSPDYSLFKKLAPRMMRDLMRDFSPLADFQAAGVVGNGGGESGGFTQIQELHPIKKDRRAASVSFNGQVWAPLRSPADAACSKIC